MKILILGDVHGCWGDLNITIARAIREHSDITHIIQCGDWGYGWPGTKPFKASKGFLTNEEMEIYQRADKLFLDGNHENFDKLENDGGAWQPGWKYMSRGTVLEIEDKRIMFFGGASSIDKENRKPHISWWPQEFITYGQVMRAMEDGGPIDAIFSHEHPTSIPYSDSKKKTIFGKGDKDMLEALKQHYKPAFWFFGHHHAGDHGITHGTEWTCCPIIEARTYTIWDGYSVRRYW